ncbi:MAG: FecR family protein [Mangrovibacterium sp.]
MNSGSRITFPSAFTAGIREIVLEEGEIYLEVAKDDTKPFQVRTSFGAVKVLGTRFNVMAYQADAVKSVVLAEGSVEVDFGLPGSLKLRPDEMLSITDETYRVDPVTAYNYTCWKDGIMKFTDEKLENVLLRLSRHYGVEFSCDEKLRAKACTGKMVLFDDIDHVLTTLSDIFPIQVQKSENQIQIDVEPAKR